MLGTHPSLDLSFEPLVFIDFLLQRAPEIVVLIQPLLDLFLRSLKLLLSFVGLANRIINALIVWRRRVIRRRVNSARSARMRALRQTQNRMRGLRYPIDVMRFMDIAIRVDLAADIVHMDLSA